MSRQIPLKQVHTARELLLFLLPLAILLVACSIAPTPTPTFEQKRTDVLRYLGTFNSIENSYNDIQDVLELTNFSDTLAVNAMLTENITALDGAFRRLTELSPSAMEPETVAHLQRAKTYYATQLQMSTAVKQATADGDKARINDLMAKDASFSRPAASALNSTTEYLMAKYNIPDRDVRYRFRACCPSP